MLQIGPIVRTWTIRHEARLNFFRQATGTLSFKNITLSLANHHQRLACCEMSAGGSVLCCMLEFKECGPMSTAPVTLKNKNDLIRSRIIEHVPSVCMDIMLSCPNWVCRDGVTYKKNNAYVVIGHDGMDAIYY